MFFADLWHFAGWVGKGVDRRKARTEKILPGGNRAFRFGALGAPKKRTVNGKLPAGSGRSKFFIVSSREAGGFLGHAVDGRGEGFLGES